MKLRISGWEVGGKPVSWLWGQINYFDIDRIYWRDVLRTYHELGHAVVSTAVLPGVHRLSSGEYDFGSRNPQNELNAFLEEARHAGLKVFLWVGPRDLPGVAAAGYPEFLLTEPQALARDAAGKFILSTPCRGGEVFCLPSLVASPLLTCLHAFSRQLQPVLAPQVYPDGPVIGLGVTQAPAWGRALSAFAADYHPEALELYHRLLKKKYGKPHHLPEDYPLRPAAFDGVEPPAAASPGEAFPSAWLLDWAQFREEYFIQAAENLHAIFAPLSQDRIPLLLATIPAAGRPNNLSELARSRCYTYAMPDTPWFEAGESFVPSDLAWQVRPLSLSGMQLPQASEDHHAREEFTFLCQLASGVRGWDVLAPAGAGAWPGFLTDRQGTPRRLRPQVWEQVRELSRTEGFFQSQIHADVVLLSCPELERAHYLQTPCRPRLDLLGLPEEDGGEQPAAADAATPDKSGLLARLDAFLSENHYAYARVSEEAAAERIQPRHLVIVPASERLSKAFQIRLFDLLRAGVNLLLVGPLPTEAAQDGSPALAELVGRKASKTKTGAKGGKRGKSPQAGRLYHLPEFNEQKIRKTLQVVGVGRELALDDARLRVFVHRLRNRIFIAAVNPTRETIQTVARREGKFVLKAFWKTKKFLGGNQEVHISLAPRSVGLWELIPC